MLVISRRQDERLILGDVVEVRVVALTGPLVFLRFVLPPGISASQDGRPVDLDATNQIVDLRVNETVVCRCECEERGRWKRGDQVEVGVALVRDGKIRLGINAPAHLPVHRGETWDQFGGVT